MLWFVFSLLTAFLEGTKDAVSKKSLEGIDEYMVAWLLKALTLPFVLPLLLFIPIPEIGIEFVIAALTSAVINSVVAVMYMKAIKISPLSLTLPMLTFTPVFLLITSPMMVGEFPSLIGVLGIFLIVTGAYMLNIKDARKGLLAPIKSLARHKGPVLMLIIAFLWSITANIDKIAINLSSVLFWLVMFHVITSIMLFPLMLIKSKNKISSVKRNIKVVPLLGILPATRTFFQLSALTLTIVPYVISIKRISSIFGAVYGHFIFKEKDVGYRLIGAFIMIIGVVLIAFF